MTNRTDEPVVFPYASPGEGRPAWHRVVWWLLVVAIVAVYSVGVLLILAALATRLLD